MGWLFACLVLAIALYVAATFIDGPVGPSVTVQGSLSNNCVPRGRQSNFFECTANLRDGSVQTFVFLRPLNAGASVTFIRRERRYFGHHYELAHVAP
jgi:hypothetical protein